MDENQICGSIPFWDDDGIMCFRRKWHGGTGADGPGKINYQWCLETGYYPVGWMMWRTKGICENPVKRNRCLEDLKTFLRSIQNDRVENRIYLDNRLAGGVTHYGIPTGEVLCSSIESAKELEDYGVRQDAITILEPPGWIKSHLKNGETKIPPFTIIKVNEWIPLNNPYVPGSKDRGQRTIYENKKTINYPDI